MDDHGKIVGHVRKCRVHGEHGPLYSCEFYSDETLAEIKQESDAYKNNLRSRKWCNEQKLKVDIDDVGIEIFRAMAGVDDWIEDE